MQRMTWTVAIVLAILSSLVVWRLSPPLAAIQAGAGANRSVKATPTGNHAPVNVPPQAAIATADLSVRAQPSSSAREVGQFVAGDVVPVVGTVQGEKVSDGNGVWLKTDTGGYVYSGSAKMQQSDTKYIDVDLRTHTALAIENQTIVHMAPVVLGRPGWPTPVGQFVITDRVSDETMDSTVLGIPVDAPGGFSYPHVRYVQYVDGGFALHYNYWAPASTFGQADSSHGCVGMQLNDAKFFWDFASVGTPVFIHQ